MDLHLILALMGTTLLFAAVPGPNVAIIIANTLGFGFRHGIATVLGTTFGVGLQLAVVVLGLTALLEVAADALIWLKWAGVIYIFYLGLSAWRQGKADTEEFTATSNSPHKRFRQGMLVALANPKTLIFNAAFLPQFIPTDSGASAPFVVAAVYLAALTCGDMIWVASANSARPFILKMGRWRHRLTGGLFFGAGFGLAMASAER